MRIVLFERIGENCVSLGDGLSLYPDLFSSMKNKETVVIDFSNVKIIYTPFLNGAFGGLFNFFDKDYILSHLSFCLISAEHLKKINEFIDNSDRLDTDRSIRETLEEFYDEDSISDS